MTAYAKFNVFKRSFWSFLSNNIRNNNVGNVEFQLQSGKKARVLNSLGTETAAFDEFGRLKLADAINPDQAVSKLQMENAIEAETDIILKDAGSKPTRTGSGDTDPTIYVIPANTFLPTDSFDIIYRTERNAGGVSTVTPKIKVGTSNSIGSATQIATYILSASNAVVTMKRTFRIESGNLIGYSFTTTLITDENVGAVPSTSTPFDVTVDNYIFAFSSIIIATDTTTQKLFIIRR
jgi:hypothetical protein